MFQLPDYFHSLSLRLTEVLDEIGVNQPMVLRRRRSFLRRKVIEAVVFMDDDVSTYCFGSQVEGTTTLGLRSDHDRLLCLNQFNVIQDWSEWCYGTCNLLMLQDETTAPGYCRLQVLRPDVPLPAVKCIWEEDIFDNCDRVLKSNTAMHNVLTTIVIKGPSAVVQETINRHGPAQTMSRDGSADIDYVFAFRCKTWRHTERPHIRHMQHQWPSNILSNIGEESGCFLVPVGHRLSYNECIEWRISPSLQERQLMFSMNITQVRCYILLKMIVKHYINPFIPECISSFHCKTTLFWCKEITYNDFWRDDNLITCIIFCLINLLQCIKTIYCPQFLIPQENLFAGKVKANNKRLLIRIIKNIIMSNGRFLFAIPFDDVGQRLSIKCNTDLQHEHNVESSIAMCLQIVETIAFNECGNISDSLKKFSRTHITSSSDDVSVHIYNTRTLIYTILLHLQGQHANYIQQAINQLLRFLYTTLGSLMSSKSLYEGNGVPRQALSWFTYGLDSDVASSRLKLASILYCSGDLYNAMLVLLDIERRYDTDYVTVICGCYNHQMLRNNNFGMKVFSTEQYTRYTAFCVRFLRSEMFCVPPALQYEMFRSDGDDVQHRGENDEWMDWAAVDSLPYLYYLQYMTYRQMGRRVDQYLALDNLHWRINNKVDIYHRETAWNLLGTCMELEERVEEAFICYRQSIGIRPRDNAAKWHITCLTFRVWQSNQRIA